MLFQKKNKKKQMYVKVLAITMYVHRKQIQRSITQNKSLDSSFSFYYSEHTTCFISYHTGMYVTILIRDARPALRREKILVMAIIIKNNTPYMGAIISYHMNQDKCT